MTTITTQSVSDGRTYAQSASTSGVGLINAEDVSEEILNIDPTDTPLLTMLRKKKASAVKHEWLADALKTVAENAAVEGAAWSTTAVAAMTRYSNPTQISQVSYAVTGTQQAVSQYGVDDLLAFQMVKAMKELKNDVEYALWQQASAVPDTGITSGRKTEGFHAMIKASSTANSGAGSVSLANLTGGVAEGYFNSMLQDIWDDGDEPKVAFMGSSVKRNVSSWTASNTKYIEAETKKIVKAVSVYESDFGLIRFIVDRRMESGATDTNHQIVAGNFDKAAIAYLRPFSSLRYGQENTVRDAVGGVVFVEYANEYGHPKSYGALICVT